MKVIITGASGFVGQNLSKFLEEQQVSVEKISLRNENFYFGENADALIHLAGKAHDTANTSSESEYFKINTDLAKTVFDKFLQSGIRDFFYFSSVKATADSVNGVLTEENTSAPQTPYGKSKQMAEDYMLSKKLPADKRLFIIRPCMIHGAGNKGNLNLLFRFAERGIPWPLAAFENKRSFLSVDNLNYLVWEMLKRKDLPSGIYNFADDEPVSTNRLINLMAEVLKKPDRKIYIPRKLLYLTATFGDFLKLPINSERLKKLTENYVVSNGRIKTVLGIDSLPLSAEEGLAKTLMSFRK